MGKRVLVLAQSSIDEDDLHDLYMYEDISEPKLVKDLDSEEESLVFKSEGKEQTDDLWDIEWFKIVSSNSHMANYVRNNDHYDCAWDENGEVEKDE
ncbi:hypothetical protein P7D72_01775 [Enterococcus avium]|uniref:hypothetical protein n=1 Tax=Enterococcus avium TaxID=33945 RepID=UPI002890B3DB|nr:hypothetical protein [Enterococcus avium]MDT2490776.1 hypothetical protein [Enterococcus avium]